MVETQEQFNDDLFNRQVMESERFMGEIIEMEIRKGSGPKTSDMKVLYLEVANLSRPLPWGNYTREVLPFQGKFTTWTKMLGAWEDRIGVKLDNKTIPTLKKKYQYLWWTAETRKTKAKDGKDSKNVTDIYPMAIPTKEEVEKVLDSQTVEVDSPVESELQNLIMSIINGLTSDELKTQMKDINSSLVDTDILKAVGDLMIAGKIKMVAKKYKIQ